jgi:hypothetical protein
VKSGPGFRWRGPLDPPERCSHPEESIGFNPKSASPLLGPML